VSAAAGGDEGERMATVTLDTQQIRDWDTFHTVCQQNLGFPAFYGRNMNAWIDCLTYLDEGDGMSRFKLGPGEKLFLEIPHAEAFRKRATEVFEGLVDCTAFLNRRYVDAGKAPAVALLLV
jgi:hypothetical protein